MKHYTDNTIFAATLMLTLAIGLIAPTANAASVTLATSPLATSTTSSVKPNLLFIIDNSGSMDWDHMPDDSSDGGSAVSFNFGYYGLRSSQCNQVYYDPNTTYLPPLDDTGVVYPDASFTAAYGGNLGGYDTSTTPINLSTSFKASLSRDKDATAQPAYYYTYSGTQLSPTQKNYHSTTNTFYSECSNTTASGITYDSNNSGSYTGTAPASGVGGLFTKVTVSSTSGPGNTDERTNFANWYSYYRTRMLMMKTASGRAFSNLNNSYRIGMMKISRTEPVVEMDTFQGTHRTDWYSTLYNLVTDGSTPLRRALSDAGRYYGGKLTNDPIQYSCQQNFTILSTDGYWNSGDGYKLDGSTAVGNQDGDKPRPYYDGSGLGSAQVTTQLRKTQTQTSASTSQIQQRLQTSESSNLQRQISQLQTRTATTQERTSDLQSSTMYLQTRTRASSSSAWTAWSDTTSCKWDTSGGSRRDCRYATTPGGSTQWTASAATWTNSASCNRSFSTSTSNGTTWTGDGTECQYTPWSAWSNVGSCTSLAQDGSDPYSVGTARQCQISYTAWVATPTCTANAVTQCQTAVISSYTNTFTCTETTVPDMSGDTTQCRYSNWIASGSATSCTDVPQDTTNPFDMSASSGVATRCTDTGWVGVNSCTASTTTGNARTCQTVNTGPTLSGSCVASAKTAANQYTQTTCNTSTLLAATPVGTCTADPATAANSYVETSCSTVSTGPTSVGSCTPEAASAANSWTATTCTSSVTTDASSDNLADIAMYYYQTDLRTTGNCTGSIAGENVCTNNVFIGGNDSNTQQHMTTFTLGLGASGWMNYSASYLTDSSGDYFSVKNGSTASSSVCTWETSGTTCNWPVPGMSGSNGLIANIDDLWHAAVNGRGAYFSATDPASLATGLGNALTGINARKGAAAAAATSTLNPVAGNNYAFVASYTTIAWKGNLEARGINTVTGAVNENADWCVEDVLAGNCASPSTVVPETAGNTTTYYCVTPNSVTCNGGTLVGTDCKIPVSTSCSGTLGTMVADTTDTRVIKTANSSGNALIDFTYANLTAAQQGYFAAAHISTLTQWGSLSATKQTAAEGANLVNYLRGQFGNEESSAVVNDRLYRSREAALGDALESEPAFMGPPVFNYAYPGYSSFKTSQANRAGIVYMGANDGMMHAFYAQDSAGAGSPCVIGAISGEHCGGEEAWAYVPSMVIANMWKLADTNYDTQHINFVNGSPITSDVCISNCTDPGTAVWKTILVAGLNGGGRGYYAMDITNPASPALLWEFTTTAGIGSTQDDDLGYSFGHPVITRKEDGTWVVLLTSGYNNTSPGSGKGYLYVLNAGTGTIISKIATGAGSGATPSGLSQIAGWNNEPAGNLAGFVYGGDLLGNVWRFDINSAVVGDGAAGEIGNGDALLFATLKGPSGVSQPVTTTPVLGKINEKRIIFIGTGKYLETSDLTNTEVQSIYAIKDDNATTTLVNARNSLVHQTIAASAGGAASRTSGNVAVDFTSDRGWYIDLPDGGERVNIDSTLVQGTLIIPSIVPSNTACSPGGYGWLNYFDYRDGGAVDVNTSLVSEKMDSTIVGVNVLYIDGEPKVGVVTSTNPTPSMIDAVSFAANAPVFTGKRVIWRELVPTAP
jgi:type IV pilus assembly protein PilY1